MTEREKNLKVIDRLEIVTACLYQTSAVEDFTRRFNAGDIYHDLLEETGTVEAVELKRWINICMGVLDEEKSMQQKKAESAESDEALIESLNRHISTLENKIHYQTDLLKEQKERLEVLLAAYCHK